MNHLRPTSLKCADTSHGRLVDAFTDWIIRRIDELVALDQGRRSSSP